MPADALAPFLPPVRNWFQKTLGEPTPAQERGWPEIAAGKHTLILAPTGSGKTLAAFLACLDGLWRQDPIPPGVRVLYISPLKALNNDIHRNLQLPLAGVAEEARKAGVRLPAIEAAVRTGDTPPAERQRLLRKPPHVLITTPESLHLILTSAARETLRGVTHVIVDEIHALCSNKRGVFLSLLLERLQAMSTTGFVRIGLSATQRPLDEVARFLGGAEIDAQGRLFPRPVTVIDAGVRKDLDLRVVSPVDRFGPLPERSVWPAIQRLLADEIRRHRSTIVFANNRRTVERVTAHLNEQAIADTELSGAGADSDSLGDAVRGLPGQVNWTWGADGQREIARAHHGSVSLEMRRQTEEALKEGRLPAVVATASLELGIDMGAVDLVCQLESPGSVARGLQRVGRAGHVVGQKSKGRLIPKTLPDLVEQAVLCREMAAGNVEAICVPTNCLDVLAQQVVAMAAADEWDVPALFALVRRAYPYRDLTPDAFEAVLEMVSGRYGLGTRATGRSPLASLSPRVSWDRTHNRLHALPGSKQLALVSGGTIPDTGQYAAYTESGVRVGELDEEFVYERRVGDSFALGTTIWRVESVEADRVIVSHAEGAPALIPFWRGERAGRTHDLGIAIGRFLAELSGRVDDPGCVDWLQRDYFLDAAAAHNLRDYVRRQLQSSGAVPTDRRLVVEASRDPLGDWQVILLSPLGSRFHLTLRLALEVRLTQRLGYRPQCVHHDDGILIRLADTDEPVLDLFDGLTPENIENFVLDQLADSALFALRFRQNAARALLLPRGEPGKRAPLWLQRLRGRDLLQVARRQRDFPIVAETFRECLHDHLDVDAVRQLLADLAGGRIDVLTRRADKPSPFAASLLFAFTAAFMYQYDGAEKEPGRTPDIDRDLLEQLIAPAKDGHLLDPKAVRQVDHRLRGVGMPPRSAAESSEWLRRLGDATEAELEGPTAGFLAELEHEGRVKQIRIEGAREPQRWVLTEDEECYRLAFSPGVEPARAREAAERILARYLETHALVGLRDVLERYGFEPSWAKSKLEEWARAGRVVAVPETETETARFADPENLEQVRRGSLTILRREVVSCPPPQFADFLLRWQGVHPDSRRGAAEGLAQALARLEGLPLPAELWERVVLPARVPGYQPRWLDEATTGGEWVWACWGSDSGPGDLLFWRREHLAEVAAPEPGADAAPLDADASAVLAALQRGGASFVADLARQTGRPPSAVRVALWGLLRRGLASNDHFELIRRGEEMNALPAERESLRRPARPGVARRAPLRPEGRWSLIPWGAPEAEAHAVIRARRLLERTGVVARELALMDPGMPPWRVLYEILSRMELAGDVRRGYFVEGLSGAQFALPEAARLLADTALPSPASAPVVLLHSLDPSNLYGSGAPFDIPLLDGGTRPLLRRTGNWLALRAGRPLLIVEQQGRKLTALASASREDVARAVALLPATLDGTRNGLKHRLTVEEWNGEPVTATPGRELLESAGFVHDYQGMTLYAAWK